MSQPFISRGDIHAALGALTHASHGVAAGAGLHHLVLVDLTVAAPEMPASDAVRDYAVRELLVTQIVTALNEVRSLFGLAPVNVDCSRDAAKTEMAEVVRASGRELLAWSALYYRYVRSELEFRVDELANLLAVHPRTMPRLQDDGLELLTQRLIGAERSARQTQAERRLLAALPYSVPQRLFGRDELLDASEKLLDSLTPCHVLVTGAAGVGKTAFVQELLRRWIASERLDHLIWLDEPATAQTARERALEHLMPDPGQVTLRDYLLTYRVALVIDGLGRIEADGAGLAALLQDFSAALVILINPASAARERVTAHIPVPDLDFGAARLLVSGVLRLPNPHEADAVSRSLFEHVGGNPLALRLAAELWEQGTDWGALETEVQERLMVALFAGLGEPARRAWCALALLPLSPSDHGFVELVGVELRSLDVLARHGLTVKADGGAPQLVGGARDFVRRYEPAAELARQVFDQLPSDERALGVVEQALATGFPTLEPGERLARIQAYWRAGLRRGHWARWREILETVSFDAERAGLRTAYGVCLCRLGEWASAEQVFYQGVAECGRGGQFDEQAWALAEWATLARFQGKYERALDFIAQAKRYAERAHDDALSGKLALQEAHVRVEQGDGAAAHRLLMGLPESAAVLALGSEAQLTLGNHVACRMLAQRALRSSEGNPVSQASLYSLMGRSYQAEKALADARSCFTEAVSLLERRNDLFSLARAQCNLASVLISLGQLGEAGQLLARAESVQGRLGDRVGLSATRHNLNMLGAALTKR